MSPTNESGFLTREELLSPPALDEEIVELEGFGNVLCLELSGDDRAGISETQAKAYADGVVDIKGYQRRLLALGIGDPSSPTDARVPLLSSADVPGLMAKLGGGKIRTLLNTIERLSGMGANAVAVVEKEKGDSVAPASAAGTSG